MFTYLFYQNCEIQWFRLFTEVLPRQPSMARVGRFKKIWRPTHIWGTLHLLVHLVRKDNDMPVLTDPGEFGKGSNSKSPQVSVVHWSRTVGWLKKAGHQGTEVNCAKEFLQINGFAQHLVWPFNNMYIYIYSYPTKIGKVQLYFTCKQQMSITIVAWIPSSQVLRA